MKIDKRNLKVFTIKNNSSDLPIRKKKPHAFLYCVFLNLFGIVFVSNANMQLVLYILVFVSDGYKIHLRYDLLGIESFFLHLYLYIF